MYPDEIENYTTIRQFDNHWRLLREMKDYYLKCFPRNNSVINRLNKEEALLKEYYQLRIKSDIRQSKTKYFVSH